MSLSDKVTLPCGLVMPNRLAKAAMAEAMSATHSPGAHFLTAYKEWANGGWGMILTGNVMVSTRYHGSPYDVESSHAESPETVKSEWKQYAAICKSAGTPSLVQLCHPGRQSALGAGRRWFWEKTLAPSALGLSLGPGWFMWLISSIVFGTPRAMSIDEIYDAVDEFGASAKQMEEAGFDGVQIHGAHGYLVSQFLSPSLNQRTDAFGGTPAKRAEFMRRIIKKVKESTSPGFCVGVKINSADHQNDESIEDVMEQIKIMINEGIDFVELSGGTYENPRMMDSDVSVRKESTLKREAFFLEFSSLVRQRFPNVLLMVTGGFRTRLGMKQAIESKDCDIIGIGRPSAVLPKLPNEIVFNKEVTNEKAQFFLNKAPAPTGQTITTKSMQAGAETLFYGQQIQRLARGQVPLFA